MTPMNSRKTRAAYRIAQNNTKATDTAPELAFAELFKGRVIKPPPITLTATTIPAWVFRPDFQFIDTNVLVEIDGIYHRTKIQERKTRWRDSELLARGYRVLHIDAELCMVANYWGDTIRKTESFISGHRLTEHLYA